MRVTKEVFIERANKAHNCMYDYSKVEYKNSHTPVCIICSEHGDFWQTPNNHLMLHGCPECSIKNKRRKNIYGVGVNDVPISTKDKGNNKAYKTWKGMLMRCYSSKYQKKTNNHI